MDWKEKLLKNKNEFLKSINVVCIVGAGISGIAVAKLALSIGRKVIITDSKDFNAGADHCVHPDLSDLIKQGVEIQTGGHTKEFISRADCVVISPGVPTEKFKNKYIDANMPFVGEIEFSYWFCKSKEIIAITGTNGKTTTTYLTSEILKSYSAKKVLSGGNIGNPFASFVLNVSEEDVVCLELSSFQLETTVLFRPHVGIILNLKPDHLDRYKSINAYYAAKRNLFKQQRDEDVAIEPADRSNIDAVKLIVKNYNVSSAQVDEYMSGFRGLPHRLEYIKTINGVHFVNDSKATNVDATIWALKNISGNVILLAGGKDKGIDYTELLPFTDNVKQVVLFGQAQDNIADALSGKLNVECVDNIDNALLLAVKRAQSGDTVLLSPMCSSFDQFENYQQRGDVFRESVYKLCA